ncbi:hypothetical protein CEXT_203911 [Caerostris extrusa]|uniref:Uncharacterized protein n=1 Tax=Caerostris extrusa TaxID=172846 RepID=A0AAV4VMF4_CAEEX|nr:hypothetical protein CEXT_203911 [Caerostris extrusa]
MSMVNEVGYIKFVLLVAEIADEGVVDNDVPEESVGDNVIAKFASQYVAPSKFLHHGFILCLFGFVLSTSIFPHVFRPNGQLASALAFGITGFRFEFWRWIGIHVKL